MFPILVHVAWLCVAVRVGAAQSLPKAISDDAFWQMISNFSEPEGYFPYENFVSNEDAYLTVVPYLKQNTKPGGVYFGVGPEQNFTYISAVKPAIAFIVDIRRQNMLEHLIYKATFGLSQERTDFLSRLFSRRTPDGLNSASSVDELFAGFRNAPPDRELFDANLREVIDYLKRHGSTLTEKDQKNIPYVYEAFYKGGPNLDYVFATGLRPTAGQNPAYWELMTARDQNGQQQSYLASEENFRFVQAMEKNNLVVPIVGDFSGNKAIRAVSEYLKQYDAAVSVFYASNVEPYLFEQAGAWRRFYTNVSKLPLDASSTFVRASTSGKLSSFQPQGVTGRWLSLTSPILALLNEVNRGQIQSFYDVFAFSK